MKGFPLLEVPGSTLDLLGHTGRLHVLPAGTSLLHIPIRIPFNGKGKQALEK